MKKTLSLLTIFIFACLCLHAQIRPVVISEVFYDSPLEENMLTSPKNHNNGEFIELYNPTTVDIDISGWKITDSNPSYYGGELPTTYIFPHNTIIQASNTLILAYRCEKTDFQLEELFPNANLSNITILYQNVIILDNKGEKITLFNKAGDVVDRMSYCYSKKLERTSTYWNIRAHNGTNSNNLTSIQRRQVSWTSSSIIFQKKDYYVDAPTPGIVCSELLATSIDGSLYPAGTIDTGLPVGTISGTASVSPTGAANYNIPIELPAGTNGFAPNISIAYNSQGGYGALGLGWDIGGLSSISRGMQNLYFDQKANGTIDGTTITFSNTDQLYIDGQRLILLSGTHFADGAVYGSETENYARVEIKLNTETNKIYFELTTKEGNVAEYGKTGDALLIDGDKVMSWRINKQKDVYGNEIKYTYQINGQYPQSISYANNQINFGYINSDTPQKRCINGFWLRQEKLLGSINIFVNNNNTNGYFFNYNQAENYAKLDAITPLYGPFIYAIFLKKHFNPIKITWGAESSIEKVTLKQMPDQTLNNVDNGYMYSGDIDGDGYQDIITEWTGNEASLQNGKINITLKNKNLLDTPFPPVNGAEKSKFSQLIVGDINRDGKDEIIRMAPNNIFVYSYNEASNTLSQIQMLSWTTSMYNNYLNNSNYSLIPLITNLNNDEYPDLVIIPYIKNIRGKDNVYVFSPYDAQIFYGKDNGLSQKAQAIQVFSDPWGDYVIPILGDFNANGKLYLTHLTYNDTHNINHLPNIDVVETNKWKDNIIKASKSLYGSAYTLDIDNDGFTDILFKMGDDDNNKWILKRNNGGYDVQPITEKYYTPLTAYSRNNSKKPNEMDFSIVIDYNGDGYQDLIIADDDYNGKSYKYTNWYFYKNIGGDLEKEKEENYKMDVGLSRMNPVVMDINGDGVQDLVFGDSQGTGTHYFKAYTMPEANKHNVVQSITNGLGQTEKFEYKYLSSAEFNNAPQDLTTDIRDLKAPLMVVDKYTSIDGTATAYDYKNPKTHIKGKGFLGFEKITAYNGRTKQKTVSEYEFNTQYYTSSLKKQTISIDGTNITEAVNTNGVINEHIVQGTKGEKRFIPVVTQQTMTDKIRNFTSTTDYDFDDYGVLLAKETTGGDMSTKTEYLNLQKRSPDGLLAYLPQTVRVTNSRTGQDSYVSESSYTYDVNGNIISSIDNKNTYAQTQTDYQYFTTGNLKQVTVSPNGQAARTTSYGYDPYNRFVTEKTNVLGQKSYTNYDDFGRVLSETGIDGITTSYEYNVLGQLVKKTLPTGEKIIYNTEWGVYCLYKTTVSSSVLNNITTTYYDHLGREIYSETTGFKGAILYTSTEYDPVTLKPAKVVQPYYADEPQTYTEYTYDDYLQRVKEEKFFDGTNTLITSYTYSDPEGKITVTAPSGVQTVSTKNLLGELTQRQDAGGTINYTYNALGKPVTIETNGASTTIKYDALGRQSKLIDPNAGTITYEYYADGNLKKQINANGYTTEYTYDIAGRTNSKVLKESDNELSIASNTTRYSYVASGNGIGQIKSITLQEGKKLAHSQTFTYNDRHLVQTATDNYDGRAFEFAYTYDNLWRPETTTSPSGLVTKNCYNQWGDLEWVKTGEDVIWQGTAQNSKGQFTDYQVNNGQITTVNIYNLRGELKDIRTTHGIDVIQDNHYQYNIQTGNLLARNDLANGRNEVFEYDVLDRLTKASLNGQVQYSMNYYPNGNINTKTDVGTYLYDTPRPNAMSGIQNAEAGVDVDMPQIITYTPFNKVSHVEQGTEQYNIYYGLDEQRIRTEYYQNDVLQKTRYYFGNYELDIDKKGKEVSTDYIFTPSGLTAMVKTPVASFGECVTSELYYVFTDRQGSIERITDIHNNIVSNYAYTPWGGRILLSGWDITDRGYTGHEHLTALNLINMNGRIYDPVLARFLSPDPFVQAPDFTQGFNRYAYCLNNPFKYTDPSGDFFYIDLGVGWSKDGGFSVSLGVGVGFKNGLSAGISIGYDFGNNSFSFSGVVTYAGSYVSAGYNTQSGWNVGTGYSVGAQIGIFSVSVFSAGGSYSQNGGFSTNIGWANYNQYSGFSINPSVNVSTTARWRRETEVFESDGNVLDYDEDSKLAFPYDNDRQINKMIKRYIDYTDFSIVKISAFDQPAEPEFNKDGTLKRDYYIRDNNGYLWKVMKTGQSQLILGTTIKYQRGWNYSSSILLSQIRNSNVFINTINHELTHAYINSHYLKNWRGSDDEYKRFSESSAYVAGHASVPSVFRNGIYPIVIPPNLLPNPPFYMYIYQNGY
ncbi:MAG: lamin tail domain-containing protein [Paludibacter sp.]|nr:lamin tail domain-containing protein [Paludibacter sp.]